MSNPHLSTATVRVGADLESCRVAVVAVHGRNQTADYMLENVVARIPSEGVAWVLPQADENSWYPLGFLAPLEDNQPRLDHALEALSSVQQLLESSGVPPERIVWLGFSQGACMVTEWVARHPARWGGLVAFTGGYIGPSGTQRTVEGNYAGMPAYFGVGSEDEWVPVGRVNESAALYAEHGAAVAFEIFPGRPHEISDPEIVAAHRIIETAGG